MKKISIDWDKLNANSHRVFSALKYQFIYEILESNGQDHQNKQIKNNYTTEKRQKNKN